MLRSCARLLRRGGACAAATTPLRVPARHWNQCTSYISLPPRHPMTLQETLAHITFMFVVWLVPTFVLMSQVKIWKRTYLQQS